jgi:hypothetical protein
MSFPQPLNLHLLPSFHRRSNLLQAHALIARPPQIHASQKITHIPILTFYSRSRHPVSSSKNHKLTFFPPQIPLSPSYQPCPHSEYTKLTFFPPKKPLSPSGQQCTYSKYTKLAFIPPNPTLAFLSVVCPFEINQTHILPPQPRSRHPVSCAPIWNIPNSPSSPQKIPLSPSCQKCTHSKIPNSPSHLQTPLSPSGQQRTYSKLPNSPSSPTNPALAILSAVSPFGILQTHLLPPKNPALPIPSAVRPFEIYQTRYNIMAMRIRPVPLPAARPSFLYHIRRHLPFPLL